MSEHDEILRELNRLIGENAKLIEQRNRALQIAQWLRSYIRPFKVACPELDALEKEVQG